MVDLKGVVEGARKKGFSDKEIKELLTDKGYSSQEIKDVFRKSTERESSRSAGVGREKISMIKKVEYLFSKPNYFFEAVRNEGGWDAFVLFIVIGAVIALLSFGLSFMLGSIFRYSFGFAGFLGIFGVAFGVIMLGVYVVGTFVYAGLAHLMVMMLRGEGKSTDTYRAVTYAMVPAMILNIIPFLGFLGFIYSIVLMTFGLSMYHNFSKGKAVVVALFPVIIMFVLLGFLIAWFFGVI